MNYIIETKIVSADNLWVKIFDITDRGRVTHVSVTYASIGSDNGHHWL